MVTAALLAGLLCAACKHDNPIGPSSTPPSGPYKGILVVPGRASGVISFVFPVSAGASVTYPQTITGQLSLTGTSTPVLLQGRYDPDSGFPLVLRGSGPSSVTYQITGRFAADTALQWIGDFTGISSGGIWTAAGGSTVQVLCGAYNGSWGLGKTTVAGTWNLILSNAASKNLTGFGDYPGGGSWLLGAYTAGASPQNVSLRFTPPGLADSASTATGNLVPPSGPSAAWTASGSWRIPFYGDSGVWSASSSGC